MFKVICLIIFSTILFSNEIEKKDEEKLKDIEYNPKVECLVLEDENSILCKFEVIIDPVEDQTISLKWVNPNEEITRTRVQDFPKGRLIYKDGLSSEKVLLQTPYLAQNVQNSMIKYFQNWINK